MQERSSNDEPEAEKSPLYAVVLGVTLESQDSELKNREDRYPSEPKGNCSKGSFVVVFRSSSSSRVAGVSMGTTW